VLSTEILEHFQEPHRLQVLARLGPGMGLSGNPHAILSWNGLLNGQTVLNGGGQRPSVHWTEGMIRRTRMTVQIETVRAASLDDTPGSGYMEWASRFAQTESECVLCHDCHDFIITKEG